MSKYQDKKAKVTKASQRKNPFLFAGIGLLGVLLIGIYVFKTGQTQTVGTYNVGQSFDYTGQKQDMTLVKPTIADGKVTIDLKQVVNAKIVKLEIPNQAVTLPNGAQFEALPVVAYVAPSGQLVGAVSFCEPCSGTDFRIIGDTLFCTTCGTTWSLEDLKGIQGGCVKYPPDAVKYQVMNGKIQFDEKELRSWQPRDL